MYVMRIEMYLRLKNYTNYIKMKSTDMSENPRGKLPLVNVKGMMVDDSSRILNVLKNEFHDTIDEQLTPIQKAQGIMIHRLLTGSLYWVFLYYEFATDRGRHHFVEGLRHDVPRFIISLICPMIIRSQINLLHGFGILKYPLYDIIERGKDDLKVLETLLATTTKQEYFFDVPYPSIYDTDVYSFVSFIFYSPNVMNLEWVQEIRSELPLLEQHTKRMRSLLFPKLPVVTSKKDQ